MAFEQLSSETENSEEEPLNKKVNNLEAQNNIEVCCQSPSQAMSSYSLGHSTGRCRTMSSVCEHIRCKVSVEFSRRQSVL